MSNDNGLVDEYEKLHKLKEEIELKEQEIRDKLIELAKQKNTDTLFGSNKKCSVKEYDKVIYPEDKTAIIDIMKRDGLYDKFSSISYFKLNSAIIKEDVSSEILNMVKKEKAFRVSLKEI